MRIAKKAEDQLDVIQRKIRDAHGYFKENAKRFNEFVNFVYRTSLTQDDIDRLSILQKPTLEFNILEAYASRLVGEFSKSEPTVNVRAADGVSLERLTGEFLKTSEVLEAHIRQILCDVENTHLSVKIYTDLLAGGYSVAEVYTEYLNEHSFEQKICVQRVFDPCLCGFDPMARLPDKSDGEYAFQLIPKTKKDFEDEFGAGLADKMKFLSNGMGGQLGEFNWTYTDQRVDIVLVADFYIKKKNRVKIVKLTNGHVMLKIDYERFVELWVQHGVLEQAPQVLDERWTVREQIERFRICANKVLSHEVTDYKMLPLVFFDGNSIYLRKSIDAPTEQFTKPFFYHTKGIQQLRNYAGQTLGSEIENLVQHKFVASVEGVPSDYQDAYTNVQNASVLLYNAFNKDNPEQPLPPPREIVRTPTPPIVENVFSMSDRITQSILGSYDGLLGINGNQISGVAIQQGALQSNAAAMPYLLGYIAGLNRIAQIILDLIPKFYVTPRSIPVRGIDGKREYKVINTDKVPEGQDKIYMGYDPNDLEIRITAGPNAAVQKQVALEQITRMMGASPVFAEFINTKGLETIIDNMDIRGSDQMKALALEFMEEQLQKQQAAAQQGNPELALMNKDLEGRVQAKQAEIDLKRQKMMTDTQIDIAKIALEKQKADLRYLEIMAQIKMERDRQHLDHLRREDDNTRAVVQDTIAAMNVTDGLKPGVFE